MTLQQIKAAHPWPWRVAPADISGVVTVWDAADKQVPLFTLLDYVVLTTTIMANGVAPAPAPAAHPT